MKKFIRIVIHIFDPLVRIFPIIILVVELFLSLYHAFSIADDYAKVVTILCPWVGTSILFSGILWLLSLKYKMCEYAKIGYGGIFLMSILDGIYVFYPFGSIYYWYQAILSFAFLILTLVFFVRNRKL